MAGNRRKSNYVDENEQNEEKRHKRLISLLLVFTQVHRPFLSNVMCPFYCGVKAVCNDISLKLEL